MAVKAREHKAGVIEWLTVLGPAAMTVVMVIGSATYQPWRHYNSWAVYPIWLGGFALVPWHLALIHSNRPTWAYILYGIVNTTLYAFLGFICLMLVTGDAL